MIKNAMGVYQGFHQNYQMDKILILYKKRERVDTDRWSTTRRNGIWNVL